MGAAGCTPVSMRSRALTTRSPSRGHLEKGSRKADVMATLDKVKLNISVVLGSTSMPVHQVLRLGRGAVIELDAGENDEVRILANDFPVAKGAVVVSGNRIAVEVKRMLPRTPDMR